MDLNQVNGKSFAVVVVDQKEEGTTFYGTAHWNGAKLTIDRGSDPPFEVREEWYECIQPVKSPVVKAVFSGAEFWLKVRVETPAGASDQIETT